MHPALARPRKLTYAFGNVSMFTHELPGAFSLVSAAQASVYRRPATPRRHATNHPRKPHWSIPRRPV